LDFRVVDCGDKEEAQAESAPTVPVTVSDDFEMLKQSDDALSNDALAGELHMYRG
jgi:hypothetical protein